MTGVERAGFDVLCHLEGDGGYGVSSAKLNFPNRPMHYGPKSWPMKMLAEAGIDFVMSQPPCALWSPLGAVTTRGADAWKTDDRLNHWYDSLRVLEDVAPRAWCLESVPQAYTRGRVIIDEMTKRALVRGYSVTHLLLDAKWTGIPQSRRRFFIVAHRAPQLVGYAWNWAPPPTIGEVLAEVPEPGWSRQMNDKFTAILRTTRPGEGLSDAWMRANPNWNENRNHLGKVIGRPSFQDQRLSGTTQMGAFVGDKYYHPTEERMLGYNEMLAICGYPPDWKLAPPESGWASLLARAVMPPVGFWLARAVMATLAQPDAAWADRRVTLIDARKPGVEPVDLTSQYLDESGRVRLRARSDGTIAWSGTSGVSKATSVPVERVTASIRTEPAEDRSSFSASPSQHGLTGSYWANDGREERRIHAGESMPVNYVRGRLLDAVRTAEAPRMASGEPSDAVVTPIQGRERSGGEAVEVLTSVLPRPPRNANGEIAYKPEPGEGSGKFIKRLWLTTDLSPDQIVSLVHANWSGRTTGRGDVYYNYKKLIDEGLTVRPWPSLGRKKRIAGKVDTAGPRGHTETAKSGGGPVGDDRGENPPARFDPEGNRAPSDATTAEKLPAAPEDRRPFVRSTPFTRATGQFPRIAMVDWFPRVCGATDSGAHIAAAGGVDLVTASLSGRPLAAWNTPWDWTVLPAADAARRLNEYDAVVLTDIACLAPEMTEREALPWYATILGQVTKPLTAIFHGGMAYKPVYDRVIDALISAPGFTGSIMTAREDQARARLARWPVRFVVNPFYAYREDRAAGTRPATRTREILMTARLMPNKGQQALLAMLDDLEGDAHVWGYNSFGLPSIAWRLYELGNALGYRADGEPALRADKAGLTHPNAPKFYTGRFAFTAPNGRRYVYHDGYSKLSEIDWSPWVHVALFTPAFHGLLEFSVLDAIHAGAISVVPEGTVPAGTYDGLVTIPYAGCTLNADGDGNLKGRDFDRRAVADVLNGLLRLPEVELEEIARRQYRAVRERHDPAVMRRSIESALRGEGT